MQQLCVLAAAVGWGMHGMVQVSVQHFCAYCCCMCRDAAVEPPAYAAAAANAAAVCFGSTRVLL